MKERYWKAAAVVIMSVFVFGEVADRLSGDGTGEYGNETVVSGNETALSGETDAAAEPEIQPLPVNEEEAKLLSGLYKAMEKEELSEAAKILNESPEELKTLLSESLDGKKYLYYEIGEIPYMEEISGSTEQSGLILTRFNTVFYGELKNGKPEGSCTAVQAMVLDKPRYTFASGQWKGGKMNGRGETGYRYYEGAPEGGYGAIKKTGDYTDNLLDGFFLYEAESGNGKSYFWDMSAKMGVPVLTEQWEYSKSLKEYRLYARENPDRPYVLSEEKAEAVIWNNVILWDE